MSPKQLPPSASHREPASGVGSVQGPLHGIRVMDLSRLVAGNMLSLQLADFGADVIKVESPREGDTLRNWCEEMPDGQKLDAWWRVYARNKKSVALDTRDPDAMSALRRLIDGAQVLVESFRPGTLEAMGLAPSVLQATNPGLVIVRLSGWGQSGPYRDLPGFGSLIEGFSGFAVKHSSGEVPVLPNMALADMVCGLSGAFATMAALREVEVRGGRGQVIDLSLLEPMLSIMGPDVTAFAATGKKADPHRKIAAPRGVYRCADGSWVAMSGSTDAMARRVLEVVGLDIQDSRFASNSARLTNDAILDGCIADFISGLTQEECLALFRSKGVTVGPIYDAAQILNDAHVAQRGCYVVGDAQGTLMHNVTPRLSNTPGTIRSAAPRLGEHTDAFLEEAGVPLPQRIAMRERGAAR